VTHTFTLVSGSAYFSTLKVEASCSSETSVDFPRYTLRYSPEGILCSALYFSFYSGYNLRIFLVTVFFSWGNETVTFVEFTTTSTLLKNSLPSCLFLLYVLIPPLPSAPRSWRPHGLCRAVGFDVLSPGISVV
jgi:hypothetical protein